MANKSKLIITNQHCKYICDPEYLEHVLKMISAEIEHLSKLIPVSVEDHGNLDAIFRYSKIALELARFKETSLLDSRDVRLLSLLEIIPFKKEGFITPQITIKDLPVDDPLDPYIKVMRSVTLS